MTSRLVNMTEALCIAWHNTKALAAALGKTRACFVSADKTRHIGSGSWCLVVWLSLMHLWLCPQEYVIGKHDK